MHSAPTEHSKPALDILTHFPYVHPTNRGTFMNRQDIISRIQKLSKFTTASGCTEFEAASAAAKIAELISAHDVQDSELALRADAQGCIFDEFIDFASKQGEWTSAVPPIARLYHCKVYVQRRVENILELGAKPVLAMRFFGFPQDVAACIATTSIIHAAVMDARPAKHLDCKSFRWGIVDRLQERLQELITARQAPGRGLLVLKDQLVTEEFAKHGINLGRATKRTVSLDKNSWDAGRSEGSKIDLGGKKFAGRAGQQLRLR